MNIASPDDITPKNEPTRQEGRNNMNFNKGNIMNKTGDNGNLMEELK